MVMPRAQPYARFAFHEILAFHNTAVFLPPGHLMKYKTHELALENARELLRGIRFGNYQSEYTC